MVYAACGFAFVIAILYLTFRIYKARRVEALRQEANDDYQLEKLAEMRAIQALERDLFAAE
jgi:hypothetical protein